MDGDDPENNNASRIQFGNEQHDVGHAAQQRSLPRVKIGSDRTATGLRRHFKAMNDLFSPLEVQQSLSIQSPLWGGRTISETKSRSVIRPSEWEVEDGSLSRPEIDHLRGSPAMGTSRLSSPSSEIEQLTMGGRKRL